ncbi:hypothetical protein CK203_023889 [Vitis vinifera]|uniref:Uncharacterized protein n=1 Tax=Vitis vinifera TaxID=29760 RepID=A0A438JA52_VITVI|nr:hypothetical protein CK203_023889 [Vitis vinifera]
MLSQPLNGFLFVVAPPMRQGLLPLQFWFFSSRVPKDASFLVLLFLSDFRFIGETQPGMMACKDAAKRLIDLGLVFTPVEDAVKDAVESLKAKGFLEQGKKQS